MRHISFTSLCTLLLILLPNSSFAQTELGWEELMQQLAEEMVEADDQQQWESEQEMLEDLHERPIDINSVSREQLLTLPFLDEQAADGILNYIALNGPFRSLGELRFIHDISPRQREWLRCIVYVPENAQITTSSRRDASWWGRQEHELLTRTDIPLYEREGWDWGNGIANRLRYNWKQGNHLDFGLRAEKDAGEKMFCRETPLWDSYGGHLMLKDAGIIKKGILGDYKAGFGEGLVLNNGLRLGKLSMGLWRTQSGIRPHRSADEVNFLRGAAVELTLSRHIRLTAMYSYRKLDATIANDNTVQSINTSGLHRTEGEQARKESLGSHTTALNAFWQNRSWQVGATTLYQYYDHQFHQGSTLYRQYYPEGYQFGALGVHYKYRSTTFLVSGETAASASLGGSIYKKSSSPALATINKAIWRFSPNTQLAAIQRFYSKRYFSPYASAYGENSQVQNESGFTLQLDAERLGPFALRAFVDYFYSPWPRYTMTRSSSGWEGLIQGTYSPHRSHTLLLRYSIKSKEQSDHRHLSHRLRATYTYEFSPHWTAHLNAFVHRYVLPSSYSTAGNTNANTNAERSNSIGLAIAPRTDYTWKDSRLRLSLFAVLFRTDDFQSRLYLYEPSLLQSFGLLQLYGHGQRVATTLRVRSKNRQWAIQLKGGVTHYTDRNSISTGPMLINSPWKGDLQILLQLRLP